MRILSVVFSLTLLIPGCRREADPEQLYTSSLTGLILRSGPSQQSAALDLMPFNTKVQVLETAGEKLEIQGRFGSWRRVRLNNKEGWAFDGFLQSDPPRLYFRVAAVSGLKLRQSPSAAGEMLALLPHAAIGEVDGASPQLQTIDGRSGVWLHTVFEDKPGWIFSGFAVTARDRAALEAIDRSTLDPDLTTVESVEETEQQIAARSRIVVRKETRTFKILEVHYKAVRDCESNGALYFIHKSTGKVFSSGFFGETIARGPAPLPDTLIASGSVCYCCCGGIATRLYLIEEDTVRSITWQEEQKEAGCDWNMMFGLGHQLFAENRVSPAGNSLWLLRRQPRCELPAGMSVEDAVRKGFHLSRVSKFDHELFVSIQPKGSGFDVRTETSMPPDIKEEWTKARVYQAR